MCSPLAVVGVGAAIAGTMMSNAGTMQSRNAQDSAVSNQIKLQGDHQQKEQEYFNDSLAKSQPTAMQGNADAATAARLAAIRAQGGIDGATSITPDDQTSPATKKALDQYNATNTGRLEQTAEGTATMGGLDDAFRGLALSTAPNASKIAEQANFSAGDASLLPLQLAEASRKGSGLRTYGTLLTALGSAAAGGAGGAAALGGAAGSGAGAAAGAAADSAANIVPAAASSGPFSFLSGVMPAVRSGVKYMQKPF